MEMENVLTSLSRLCESPAALLILAAVGAHAAMSLYVFFRCPVLHQSPIERACADRKAVQSPTYRSLRFVLTMLVGIALSIGGLYALRAPGAGVLAIAAIMIGVYILLSEPARRNVHEMTQRVSAARLDGDEAYAFEHARLRSAHVERVVTEVGVFLLLAIFIVSM